MTRWRLIKALLAVSAIAIVGLGVAVGVAASRDSGSSNDTTVRLQDNDSNGAAWLGLLGETSEDPTGVRVVHVFPASPADDAGLARNDVITAVDGNDIAAMEDLQSAIAAHAVGDEVTLSVVKNGEGDRADIVVTLTEQRDRLDIQFPDHFGGGIIDGLRNLFPDGFDAFLDGSFRYRDDNGDIHEITAIAGTITNVATDAITIDTKEGDSQSFDLTDDAQVPASLEPGDNVIVVSIDGEVAAVIAPGRILDSFGIPDFHFDFDPCEQEIDWSSPQPDWQAWAAVCGIPIFPAFHFDPLESFCNSREEHCE